MSTDSTIIAADTVVTFHYHLRDAEGAFKESSEGDSPVVYLHGHANIVPGLEAEMTGKKRGDKFTATVTPEQAYGLRSSDELQRVPLKHLVDKGRPVVGQMVSVKKRDGVRHALVVKVGHFNVDVDLNHPLAGTTLLFDIEIVDVRAATGEELTHGHAHGPGGHDHEEH